jgi:hypothetical protein
MKPSKLRAWLEAEATRREWLALHAPRKARPEPVREAGEHWGERWPVTPPATAQGRAEPTAEVRAEAERLAVDASTVRLPSGVIACGPRPPTPEDVRVIEAFKAHLQANYDRMFAGEHPALHVVTDPSSEDDVPHDR